MTNAKEYSKELLRFINTVAQEAASEKADGILARLNQITGGERDVFEFIVSEGFGITYDEFLDYYKACKTGVAVVSGKLSDDDLDNVAGGFSFRKAAKSVGHAVSSTANKAANVVKDTTKYVADNPAAFVAAGGVIGGGAGTAGGAVLGGVVGGMLGNLPGAGFGAGLGASVGGGAGAVVGSTIGIGTVIIANELTD